MRTILCAIAKYENLYIVEWIKYHLQLGFSHIYIYDNNDSNGENIKDVIPHDLHDRVSIIEKHDQKHIQKNVYNECYHKNTFDWCAFIDIDEFITLQPPYDNIQSYLKDCMDFEMIHLNWMCYGDNNQTHYKKEDVQKRFTKPLPSDFKLNYNWPENNHIKSIIKSGLDIDWTWDNGKSNPHTPGGIVKTCNNNFEPIENSFSTPYSYEKAYIRHYITKTIEEYIWKIQRSTADIESEKYYTFAKFYSINKISLTKLFIQHKAIKKYRLSKDVSILQTIKDLLKIKHPNLYKTLYFKAIKKI